MGHTHPMAADGGAHSGRARRVDEAKPDTLAALCLKYSGIVGQATANEQTLIGRHLTPHTHHAAHHAVHHSAPTGHAAERLRIAGEIVVKNEGVIAIIGDVGRRLLDHQRAVQAAIDL